MFVQTIDALFYVAGAQVCDMACCLAVVERECLCTNAFVRKKGTLTAARVAVSNLLAIERAIVRIFVC